MIVAIDGTVSSGKSTIAKKLAEHLDFLYCNTGAIYRAITIKILNKGYQGATDEEIFNMLQRTVIAMGKNPNGGIDVFLDGQDVTKEIRTPLISQEVVTYSKIPQVREYVRNVQKQIAKNGDCVIEGRDIGTVVFPNAEVKIFMTADVDVRAKRRWNDYIKLGKDRDFEQVKAEIIARDKADMERPISPLKPADDAIIYYNDGDNIDKVIDDLAKIVKSKQEINFV